MKLRRWFVGFMVTVLGAAALRADERQAAKMPVVEMVRAALEREERNRWKTWPERVALISYHATYIRGGNSAALYTYDCTLGVPLDGSRRTTFLRYQIEAPSHNDKGEVVLYTTYTGTAKFENDRWTVCEVDSQKRGEAKQPVRELSIRYPGYGSLEIPYCDTLSVSPVAFLLDHASRRCSWIAKEKGLQELLETYLQERGEKHQQDSAYSATITPNEEEVVLTVGPSSGIGTHIVRYALKKNLAPVSYSWVYEERSNKWSMRDHVEVEGLGWLPRAGEWSEINEERNKDVDLKCQFKVESIETLSKEDAASFFKEEIGPGWTIRNWETKEKFSFEEMPKDYLPFKKKAEQIDWPAGVEAKIDEAVAIKERALRANPYMRTPQGEAGKAFGKCMDEIASALEDAKIEDKLKQLEGRDMKAKIALWALDRKARPQEYARFATHYVDRPEDLFRCFARAFPLAMEVPQLPSPITVDEDDREEEHRLVLEYSYYAPPLGKAFANDCYRMSLADAILKTGEEKSRVLFQEDLLMQLRVWPEIGKDGRLKDGVGAGLSELLLDRTPDSFQFLARHWSQSAFKAMLKRHFDIAWREKRFGEEYRLQKRDYAAWQKIARGAWQTAEEKALAQWILEQAPPVPMKEEEMPKDPFAAPDAGF